MIVAVIDLGTNTSNLVVARLKEKSVQILFQGKEYVRLGDHRITEDVISEEAMYRALVALQRQVDTARHWQAEIIRIIATSAVRHAGNRLQFTDAIKVSTGLETEIIDGEREATLIYYGVRLALGSLEERSAILDIGGGSNEIILCENGSMHWKGSFQAGMLRIINSFSISNPITPEETKKLSSYFEDIHYEAMEKCRSFGVKTLIGCSGAFNTLADIIDEVMPEEKFRKIKEIGLPEFMGVYSKILASTSEDRVQMRGMDPVRTELIVPAMILSRTLIENTPISRIIQTSYALREGVLFEMVNS